MYLLDRFFERTAVISLPRRADRRERIAAHLSESGLTKNPVWFDAVDGRTQAPPRGWNSGPAAWGCHSSHVAILEQAKRDRLHSILILEDDAVFSPHTRTSLPQFMAAVPRDWQQIYLGGQHLMPPRTGPHPLVICGHNVNRTHAYAVSAPGLDGILAFLNQWRQRLPGQCHHIDHHYGLAHRMRLWPVYCPRTWFAGQAEEVSDIYPSSEVLPLRWWHGARHGLSLPLVAVPAQRRISDQQAAQLEFPEATPAAMGDAALASQLLKLARRAAVSGRLPAWRTSPGQITRLRRLWHNEVIPLQRALQFCPHQPNTK